MSCCISQVEFNRNGEPVVVSESAMTVEAEPDDTVIRAAVREILSNADLNVVTRKVVTTALEAQFNRSLRHRKSFIKTCIGDYLAQQRNQVTKKNSSASNQQPIRLSQPNQISAVRTQAPAPHTSYPHSSSRNSAQVGGPSPSPSTVVVQSTALISQSENLPYQRKRPAEDIKGPPQKKMINASPQDTYSNSMVKNLTTAWPGLPARFLNSVERCKFYDKIVRSLNQLRENAKNGGQMPAYPSLGGVQIDIYSMCFTVMSLGGYSKVSKLDWERLYTKLVHGSNPVGTRDQATRAHEALLICQLYRTYFLQQSSGTPTAAPAVPAPPPVPAPPAAPMAPTASTASTVSTSLQVNVSVSSSGSQAFPAQRRLWPAFPDLPGFHKEDQEKIATVVRAMAGKIETVFSSKLEKALSLLTRRLDGLRSHATFVERKISQRSEQMRQSLDVIQRDYANRNDTLAQSINLLFAQKFNSDKCPPNYNKHFQATLPPPPAASAVPVAFAVGSNTGENPVVTSSTRPVPVASSE
ncbi:hypothetical protein AAMO2058_000641200 [Amorphochlora amoebiformis]